MALDQRMEEAAVKYRQLRQKLEDTYPEKIHKAHELAAGIVDALTGSSEQCWNKLWDKPLWANSKAKSVEPKAELLRPFMMGQWKAVAQKGGPYEIEKWGKGFSVKSFKVAGETSRRIMSEIRIAPHRLYAIRRAADALTEREALRKAPFSDIPNMPLDDAITLLRKEFGFGWGHITILHFLTDMGLACKPDIHVVRTLKYLGFQLSERDKYVPTQKEAVQITEIVKKLTEKVKGNSLPASLREVDYILMRISLCKIIPG